MQHFACTFATSSSVSMSFLSSRKCVVTCNLRLDMQGTSCYISGCVEDEGRPTFARGTKECWRLSAYLHARRSPQWSSLNKGLNDCYSNVKESQSPTSQQKCSGGTRVGDTDHVPTDRPYWLSPLATSYFQIQVRDR